MNNKDTMRLLRVLIGCSGPDMPYTDASFASVVKVAAELPLKEMGKVWAAWAEGMRDKASLDSALKTRMRALDVFDAACVHKACIYVMCVTYGGGGGSGARTTFDALYTAAIIRLQALEECDSVLCASASAADLALPQPPPLPPPAPHSRSALLEEEMAALRAQLVQINTTWQGVAKQLCERDGGDAAAAAKLRALLERNSADVLDVLEKVRAQLDALDSGWRRDALKMREQLTENDAHWQRMVQKMVAQMEQKERVWLDSVAELRGRLAKKEAEQHD